MQTRRLTYGKAGLIILLTLLTALLPGLAAAAQAEIVLKKGDKGESVLLMKQRLFELGYLSTSNLSDSFNSEAQKALKRFQKADGLEASGVLDAETHQRLYAQDATGCFDTVLAAPVQPQIEWPERDADGYLADEGEFWYEDDEGGFWAYLTRNLQITILKRADESIPLEWFETDIRLRGQEKLLTVENNPERPGTHFRYPFDIATDSGFVLGFSDDFYGHRMYQKEKVGIVIREGEVLGDETYSKRLHNLPNLDMLAQFADGSLIAYRCGEITAQELTELGAVNVYCFGPVLMKDGEMDPMVLEGWYETKSPRQALGMYEPGHYLLLSVLGRMESSEGTGLIRLTRMLNARGVREALNLDGGNTMALVFRGRMLNQLATWKNKKFVRTVSSLIGVGQTVYPPQEGE